MPDFCYNYCSSSKARIPLKEYTGGIIVFFPHEQMNNREPIIFITNCNFLFDLPDFGYNYCSSLKARILVKEYTGGIIVSFPHEQMNNREPIIFITNCNRLFDLPDFGYNYL